MDKLQEILSIDCAENAYYRCSLCNKYLSVSPVYCCFSIGNICGRCNEEKITREIPNYEISKLQRQTIFENLTDTMKFPCSFDIMGCKVKLNKSAMIEHENRCAFKSAFCPLSVEKYLNEGDKKCTWNGKMEEIILHMSKQHEIYFSPITEVCLTPEFKSKIILMNIPTKETVLIKLDYKKDSYKYLFEIYADLPYYKCKEYFCELKILNKDKTGAIVFRKDNLTPLVRNFFDMEGSSSYLEIDIHPIREILKKTTVTISFNIVKKNQKISSRPSVLQNFSAATSEFVEEFLDEEMTIDDLKCSKCKRFLTAPVYSIPEIGNVCFKCNDICNSQSEPSDISDEKNTIEEHNLTLELLVSGLNLNYPCKRREQGCTFRGIPPDVIKHEEDDCPQATTDCIFQCGWKGCNNLLLTHIQEKHSVLEKNMIYKITKETNETFLLYFEDQPFLLTLEYKQRQSLNFNIFCVGKTRLQYKYDLTLIGSTSIGIKLLLTHICQPIPTIKIPDNFTGISVPFSCLKQFFINSDELKFKVNISKIKKSNEK